MCIGIGTIGIRWDYHRNGSDNDCIMVIGRGVGIKVWKWEWKYWNENEFQLQFFNIAYEILFSNM